MMAFRFPVRVSNLSMPSKVTASSFSPKSM